MLVTMESLLFAGLNVGLALAAPVAGGRNISPAGAHRLATFALAALAIVASGAVLAWWQVFGDNRPHSLLRVLEAAAAVIGIAAQPIISFFAVRAIKPKGPGAAQSP